ncbi:MAG: hypothetical protein P4M13_09590 [Alphaproteobacteria bacterium]|nr:hypothetical protein [Alphaproteobacteria bacterium]
MGFLKSFVKTWKDAWRNAKREAEAHERAMPLSRETGSYIRAFYGEFFAEEGGFAYFEQKTNGLLLSEKLNFFEKDLADIHHKIPVTELSPRLENVRKMQEVFKRSGASGSPASQKPTR